MESNESELEENNNEDGDIGDNNELKTEDKNKCKSLQVFYYSCFLTWWLNKANMSSPASCSWGLMNSLVCWLALYLNTYIFGKEEW